MVKRNFSIMINVRSFKSCYRNILITNCQWLEKLSFSKNPAIPEINNYYIQIVNNSNTYQLSKFFEQSSLCVCTDELHYDCHVNDLIALLVSWANFNCIIEPLQR